MAHGFRQPHNWAADPLTFPDPFPVDSRDLQRTIQKMLDRLEEHVPQLTEISGKLETWQASLKNLFIIKKNDDAWSGALPNEWVPSGESERFGAIFPALTSAVLPAGRLAGRSVPSGGVVSPELQR